MIVISIEEAVGKVSSDQASFTPAWKLAVKLTGATAETPIDVLLPSVTDWSVQNPRFGRVESCVIAEIADDEMRPLWDQYRIIEVGGAIVVPWFMSNDHPYVVLIRESRPVALGDNEEPGATLWSLPRGFKEPGEAPEATAWRELLEETGHTLLEVEQIGKANPNTAFYQSAIPIYAARLNPNVEVHRENDPSQQISEVAPFRLQSIYSLDLQCGLTMSGLFAFTAFARSKGMCRLDD